ncbi:MAG TPA: exodeoxyribonuclease VII large subunit [Stellaceae bacterium]|nr:exodeoxyribonuclease VII large subunit [Stellaceae bacterium]
MTESPVATSSAARPNLPEYTVGELSALLKRTVEQNFSYVRVRGEISGFKRHSSGHSYFALKDADALLDAVSWRGTRLTIKPEDGMEVVCTGRLTTYPARSRYQLVVESMELAGIGALLKLLEERKARLAAEGLFAEARKKPLPYLPDIIGIVTSPTGAVIRDILHRLADRFPRYVLIWPVAVQGEGAGSQVAAAIEGFNRLLPQGTPPRPDLLIVARGGGSLEDLMAFNEEIVVRAAAASAIPLISAVGHETDTTLIDFASDKRAPTPSAAAEMAVPVRLELRAELGGKALRLANSAARLIAERRLRVEGLARGLPAPRSILEAAMQTLDDRAERLDGGLRRLVLLGRQHVAKAAARLDPVLLTRQIAKGRDALDHAQKRLDHAVARLVAQHLRALEACAGRLLGWQTAQQQVMERGYVRVRDERDRVLTAAADVAPGAALSLEFHDGRVAAVASPAPKKRAREAAGKKQGELL